jgi:hypothetical protein
MADGDRQKWRNTRRNCEIHFRHKLRQHRHMFLSTKVRDRKYCIVLFHARLYARSVCAV